jgi:formylglycine-generating enzyme required for sulfatase activity
MANTTMALTGGPLLVTTGVPRLGPGQERTNPVDGAAMVWVPGTAQACPGGRFRMGSTPEETERLWESAGWVGWREGAAVEQPAHEVQLDGFWIYKHQVTVGRYAAFVAETGYAPPAAELWDALRRHADLPMLFVGWADASAYCEWAGVVLPTEAQWEYAARGPEERLFPWGDDWDRTLCNCADYHAGHDLPDGAAVQAWWGTVPQTADAWVEHLRPVGSFPEGASWCGALDMAGSVWEWCRDWFDEAFYTRPEAGGTNPECRDRRSHDRVLRGGSWMFDATRCRGANRGWYNPDDRLDFGIRPLVPAEAQ